MTIKLRSQRAVALTICIAACGAAMFVYAEKWSPAEIADTRFGTARSYGSDILGPSLPHGSAHPSPDSLWPTQHVRPKGARHGFGPPTSGWRPGDKVVGFSQLHAQGTGGTPSYGIFRYVFEPDDMEILESHPYRLRTRMKKSGLLVDVSATAHGAVSHVRKEDGTPVALPLDRKCKIAKSDCLNKSGEFTGNWNPAPYRCWAHSEVDVKTGLHRIAVSFHSEQRAKEHFARELAGRSLEEIAAAAKAKWETTLACIDIEGVDDAERRKFYSLLMETFIQPRDRTADGIGWDDHYTLWDTWRTYWPLKSIIDPATLAANVNSFADRFEATGECTSCRTSGKEFKIGAGGDEADCIVADAWAKKIPGIDWKRVAKLLRGRWNGRTEGYRTKGYVPVGERGGYCPRFKSGSATMNFAYEDWCCAEVLEGLGEKELAEKFRARSGNWKNVWDDAALDAKSGVRGFVRGRNADGSFSKTDPRGGFNKDFYEANCWEYSLFVPHDVSEMIKRCGGKDGFERRLTYALDNGLVDFSNEPSFHVPWLYAYVGRGDLAAKWTAKMAALFKGENLPGDNDSGAMCSLWVFIRLGFFPVAGQDVYIMHGSTYPKITIRPPGGKAFMIRAVGYAPGSRVKTVTLNGKPHDPLFLRHAEIAAGGELVFTYEAPRPSPRNGEPYASVRPTKAHLEYQAREIMALVSWGLNPYTGQEWGFGNVPPSKITAKRLDPAQWAEAMKTAEIKSVVLVAKHHDGFCLWPATNNLEYSMAVVPAPNTGRDLVRELADACRANGMKFGVYLSPWDRHQGSYATPAYVDYFFAQWNDLMDNYGELCEMWLDGANGGTGWYGGVNGEKGERRSIPSGYYRYPERLELMHAKHPMSIAFGGGTGGWSSVWCGNESGVRPDTWGHAHRGLDGEMKWVPSEADFPLRRGWYWHAGDKPKSLARLVKIYFETVGRGAVMNIGIAPDVEGRVCEDDVKRLAEFGEWVRDFNSRDFAKGAKVTERRDGNKLVIEIALNAPEQFNCVDVKEKIEEGQLVESFTVEAPDGEGGWNVVARGTTVGYRRLARVPSATYSRVRVTLNGIAPPKVLPIALRRAKEVAGEVTRAADTYDKSGWRIVDETCAAPRNASSAIDGNHQTLWHSHAAGAKPLPPPQSFTVDCGAELAMHGFDYVPRMDGCRHGMVDGYEFHVSKDGRSWTKVAAGEFGNIAANPVRQRVMFATPVKARYFRFTATHAVEANDRVALAEIDILPFPFSK